MGCGKSSHVKPVVPATPSKSVAPRPSSPDEGRNDSSDSCRVSDNSGGGPSRTSYVNGIHVRSKSQSFKQGLDPLTLANIRDFDKLFAADSERSSSGGGSREFLQLNEKLLTPSQKIILEDRIATEENPVLHDRSARSPTNVERSVQLNVLYEGANSRVDVDN